jgi:hypothetical protein
VCQWDATQQARAHDLERRGDRATALAITGYSVGGAALVTGVVLYMLGDRYPKDTVATVMPVPGGGLLVARWQK